jgi:hypothetical protein
LGGSASALFAGAASAGGVLAVTAGALGCGAGSAGAAASGAGVSAAGVGSGVAGAAREAVDFDVSGRVRGAGRLTTFSTFFGAVAAAASGADALEPSEAVEVFSVEVAVVSLALGAGAEGAALALTRVDSWCESFVTRSSTTAPAITVTAMVPIAKPK